MVYTQDIPKATQRGNTTTDLIRDNFDEIAAWLSVNHEMFGAEKNQQGMHTFLQFLDEPGPVFPPTTGDQVAMYNRVSGVAPQPIQQDLFFKPEQPDEFTQPDSINVTRWDKLSGQERWWTVLPSNIIVKWGTRTLGAGVTADINIDFGRFFERPKPGHPNRPFRFVCSRDSNTFSTLKASVGFNQNWFLSVGRDDVNQPISFYFLVIGRGI